jgi:hypothetical protein
MASSLQSNSYGIKLGLSKSDSPQNFSSGFTPTPYGGSNQRNVSAKISHQPTVFDKLGMNMTDVNTPSWQRSSGYSRSVSAPSNEPTTIRTTTKTVREGEAPEAPNLPDFVAPEWDEGEVKKKTQRNAAPGVRQLRQTVQQAMGRNYENPNVRRMTMRDVLSGYGMGLEGVMAGAAQQANQEYSQQHARDYNEASVNYQSDVNQLMAQYNNAWNEYMNSGETVTTQTRNAGEIPGEDGQHSGGHYSTKFGQF